MQQRLEDLASYQLLGNSPDQELDDMVKIASTMCDAPISFVTFFDDKVQYFKATYGVDIETTEMENSFCQYLHDDPKNLLVVEDSFKDERFSSLPIVANAPHIRFYAGAPLLSKNGHLIGSFCVLGQEPKVLNDSQRDALTLLADKTMNHLNSRKVIDRQASRIKMDAARLIKLTDQTPGALYQFQMDKNGHTSFTFVSKGIEQLHPHVTAQKLIERPELVFKAIHPDDLQYVQDSIEESYRTLNDWHVECRVLHPDGSVRWFSGTSRPESDGEGTVTWYGTIQDITESKDYEKTLEDICFDISHVLRSPVTSILGLTDLIENGTATPDEFGTYVSYLKSASAQLDEFTKKLNHSYDQRRNKKKEA